MNYFTDLVFKTVIHTTRFYERDYLFSTAGYYSLELVRCGTLRLLHCGVCTELQGPVLFWLQKDEKYVMKRNLSREETADHIYCDFSGERAERIIRALNAFCPKGYLTPGNAAGIAEISEIFFELLKYYRLGKRYYQPEMVLCVETLLLRIAAFCRPAVRPDDDPYHIWKTGDDIRKDPFQKFDFRRTARQAGISTDHYRRLFRAAHKQSPAGFVKSQRLIRSAELLVVTDMRIKEIAFSCGFHSMVDFSRSFKHYFGLSPRTYRTQKKMQGSKNPAADPEGELQRD